jgi:ATP-dependent helicase/nuclease subunit B
MGSDYLTALAQGTTLVTPSRRLAGLIAERYSMAMRDSNNAAWEAPSVLPFAAWLSDSFQRLALAQPRLAAPRILLTMEQERAVWEQVIYASDEADPEQVENLAGLAMNAWSVASLWALPMSAVKNSGGRQEVRAFVRWTSKFEQRCRALDAVDHHQFAAILGTLEHDQLSVLPAFEFFGFPRLPTLLEHIEKRIDAVGSAPPMLETRSSVPFEYRAFANRDIELSAAMSWAGEQKQRSPHASVTVVLAGVKQIDANLEQRLRRAFSAALSDEHEPKVARLCFPGSMLFTDVPIIDTALRILDLRLLRPWDDVSRLLLSPYLGGAEVESDERALLDYELRRRGDVEVSTASVIELARTGRTPCPALVGCLEALLASVLERPRRQRVHDWMRFAETALAAAGWPGARELNEIEQAALVEWQRAMDAAAQLDTVMSVCTWQRAFSKWRQVLRGRQLRRQNDIDAVQLVTFDEAAFLRSDALWVAGLHDGTVPDPPEVTPLLPFPALRDHGVPGADPVADLGHAEDLLRQLAHQHPQAIWSYPRTEGDTPRRPLPGYAMTFAELRVAPLWLPQIPPMEFEIVNDSHATGLDAGVGVSGGVGLFTDQAACPMRAFARHRVNAQTPADSTPGLNPMQRGNLIHAVMASFWTHVVTSTRLVAMADEEFEQVLNGCVSGIVTEFRVRYRFVDAFWELECDRLVELAGEWLRLERNRGEFEVIACEQSRAATVGNYIISTRVDRVDRLANGETIVIDYKTGAVPRSSWQVPRPDQPQLPLYAVATGGALVDGIAYAGLKKGQCKFVDAPKGIGGGDGVDEDAKQEWIEDTQAWMSELDELARELEDGLALANPKRGAATCRYCDLQCFCRIYESTQQLADGDYEDE